MTEKTITIGDKNVTFKASAATPRLYRIKFRRDLFKDLTTLQDSTSKNNADSSTLPIESLETFENVAYIMAKQADPSIPEKVNDWLDGFEMFSIYEILPEILSLWGANVETQSESKK